MNPPRKSLNVVNPNDKVGQLRDAFAAGPGPTPAAAPTAIDEDAHAGVIAALRTVYDPEIPVNVYDLGLVYGIARDAAGKVSLTMTLTAPGCPVADDILADVRRKVRAVPGVTDAGVELVFDPPWTKERMSEAALLELGLI